MKINKNLTLTVLFAVMALTTAQVVTTRACPENIKVIESFDVTKYLGKWYEYSKYPVYFEAGGKCVTAEYSLNAEGNVNVTNSLVNEKTNKKSGIMGSATLVSVGKLLVKFTVSPVFSVSSNYWVLATDYDNYAVVYSCTSMTKSLSATIVWILTRQQVPPANIIETAIAVLKNNNISLVELTTTNHSSC